ncbi:hypothetical protein Gotri_000403 [Gossypium trilobum]|uniref:Receptor-like serine/threonine-protein kinase n=2 Tax=Gossypium trilobum TaxID=34281 RepID=A0A7J9FBJ6_9ROSI|nr:hypothetical protein [Gossypium trilobum]
MNMIMNSFSYFLMITLLILLIVPSSFFIDAETKEYPSFVRGPNSWRITPSSDFSFPETDISVMPVLVNGIFVCGFHCSYHGNTCQFAISIFNTSFNGDYRFPQSSFPPQVVWSANRDKPVDVQALLELTFEGKFMLKDANDTSVWSQGTVGKLVSRLNLTAEGNLMLLNKADHIVWQSFDHPTDTLVRGQRLVPGQKLKASVSPDDPREGLYAFAISRGVFTAYMDLNPPQIYYTSSVEDNVEFKNKWFGSFYVGDWGSFIRLGSDGHLKAYELTESGWEGIDLLGLDQCSYPLPCGKYSLCSKEGCSCLDTVSESETTFFKPINSTSLDHGCYAVSPISCEPSVHHSFIELKGGYSQPIYSSLFSDTIITLEICKETCLKNCSCKAAIYNLGYCYFLSQVFSIEKNYSSDYYSNSAFIKVQNYPEKKRQNGAVIVGSTLGAVLVVLLICGLFFLRAEKGFEEAEEHCLDNMLGMPTRFSYEELKNITKNFSNKLGEGGFGSVFHGILPLGSDVAVKHQFNIGAVNKSFIAEVQTIGSIHHYNLVSLVGFCAESSNRLLVYEYMANGSLDRWIFNQNRDLALGWQIRRKIILDIAKGLAYLHEECNQKIIHLDIKPQNILLDENFNAKISDFGLSKLIGKDQSRVITAMRGTPGYMAPEWLSSCITEKVDVYSFGIVVLEILCGRRNVDVSQQEEDMHLLGLFRRKQEEGQLMDLVDKCSDDMQSNAAEVVELMKVAAWCLQTEYARRPSMSTVVKLFEGSVDVTGSLNEDFLNGLTLEPVDTFPSIVLPSMLSGPR